MGVMLTIALLSVAVFLLTVIATLLSTVTGNQAAIAKMHRQHNAEIVNLLRAIKAKVGE